jgi:hypothetical protein
MQKRNGRNKNKQAVLGRLLPLLKPIGNDERKRRLLLKLRPSGNDDKKLNAQKNRSDRRNNQRRKRTTVDRCTLLPS